MPKIDKHAPGSFCWVELATTDQNSAKSFYSSLFGWSPADFPMGPSESYTMFKLDGRDAAAGYTIPAHQAGEPPHWNLYIAVANVDDAVKHAEELGAKVLAAPFDVMDAGRMAVIQDPTGAIFCIWQANKSVGITVAGENSTLCWADLSTAEPQVAKQFYEALFGWNVVLGEKDTSGYLHIMNGTEFIGGVPAAAQRNPNAPPHWMVYFQVADCDASTAKGKQLGAKVYMPPTSMEGIGKFSVIADPQGAAFSLFEPPKR